MYNFTHKEGTVLICFAVWSTIWLTSDYGTPFGFTFKLKIYVGVALVESVLKSDAVSFRALVNPFLLFTSFLFKFSCPVSYSYLLARLLILIKKWLLQLKFGVVGIGVGVNIHLWARSFIKFLTYPSQICYAWTCCNWLVLGQVQ